MSFRKALVVLAVLAACAIAGCTYGFWVSTGTVTTPEQTTIPAEK